MALGIFTSVETVRFVQNCLWKFVQIYAKILLTDKEEVKRMYQIGEHIMYKKQVEHLLVDEFSYALNETPELSKERLYRAMA